MNPLVASLTVSYLYFEELFPSNSKPINMSHVLVSPATVSQGPGAYCGPHSLCFDTAATVSPTPICSTTDGLSDKSSGGITNSELSVF